MKLEKERNKTSQGLDMVFVALSGGEGCCYWTQGFMNAKHTHYHWPTLPDLKLVFLKDQILTTSF
jgi:hypothetical protein